MFDTHAANPSLIPNLPFDTLRDLTPVMLVGTGGMALVTPVTQPYSSFRDVVAAAKARPGSVSYGTIGAGSIGHLAMAQLGKELGVEFNHVPYRGGGPLMNDAIANQVPLAIGSVFLVSPHVASGRVRAIAVTSAKPDPKLPGVEPIAGQGVARIRGVYVVGRSSVPPICRPGLAQRIYEELAKAVKAPDVVDKLSAQGIEVLGRAAGRARRLRPARDRTLGEGHPGQQHQVGGLIGARLAAPRVALLDRHLVSSKDA